MKSFLRLYLKELRFLSGIVWIFILALFVILVVRIIEDLTIVIDGYDHGYVLIHHSNFGTPFISGLFYCFPIILVYSLYVENRSKTIYQLAALPTNRWLIPAAKILAVVSVGMLCLYVSNIIDYQPWRFYLRYFKTDYYRLIKIYEKHGLEYPSVLTICLGWIKQVNFFRLYKYWYLMFLFGCSFVAFASIVADLIKKWKIRTLISVFLILTAVNELIENQLKTFLHNWSLSSLAKRMFLEYGIQTMFVMVLIVVAFVLYERFKEV